MASKCKRLMVVLMSLIFVLSTMRILGEQVQAAAVAPESGNIYYIKNKNSGMYLTVEGDSSANGANVCQKTGTGSLGQRWVLEKNANGTFRLHPATDMTGGVSLDVTYGNVEGGTNIQIWENNGLSPQNFGITPSGDGYAITTEVTQHKSCLDVSNASKASGANVVQWTNKEAANQIWYFEEAQWPSGGSGSGNVSSGIDANGYPDQLMEFVSTSDGTFVTASSINTTVKSNATASTSNRWKLVKKGEDYYQIINAANGYALAPTGNNATNGASVVVTGVANNNAQYWKIVAVKTDTNGDALNYKVVNYANTNLALTLSNGSYQLSSYSGGAAQNFRFISHGAEGFAGYCKDMSNKEKASVTGGVLGTVVYVSNISDLQKYASGSTPYMIIINANISATDLTKVTVGKNKTFIGKFGSGTLNNIHFRCISSSGNVIFKNITFKHDASKNENDDIQMYISNGNNFWVDHCTFTGHTSMTSTDVDKHMYVGLKADYVSVTGCYFGGHKYGLILGYPEEDGVGTYDGYPRMTIANNYFYNNYTRAPGLMRYGYFHCYNNYIYGFNLGYTPYTGCNIYSEKNYFDKGNYAGCVVDDHGVGSFTDTGSVLTSSVSDLKTGSTSWRPISNYSYATRNASDAKTWAQQCAGAQASKIVYAID